MINTVTNFSSSNFIFFYKNLLFDVYPADSCIYFEEDEKKSLFWKLYFTCENFHVLPSSNRIT